MKMKQITLGRIIRWFKGRSTFEIHKQLQYSYPIWQKRFYDHIINDDEIFDNVREYIELNPLNWDNDKHNIENLKQRKS